jgi:hypothetical protein
VTVHKNPTIDDTDGARYALGIRTGLFVACNQDRVDSGYCNSNKLGSAVKYKFLCNQSRVDAGDCITSQIDTYIPDSRSLNSVINTMMLEFFSREVRKGKRQFRRDMLPSDNDSGVEDEP